MNIQTRPFLALTLLFASVILPLTTHAAPTVDPRVIGTWRTSLTNQQDGPGTMAMTLLSEGTESETILTTGHRITMKANYITQANTLAITYTSSIDNGKATIRKRTYHLKYAVTPTTLTINDGSKYSTVVFHRVTSAAASSFPTLTSDAQNFDPNVIGTWQAIADLKSPTPSHLSLTLRPNGTATMTGRQARDIFTGQADVLTRTGVLTLVYVKYTQNVHPILGHQTQAFKYSVTPTTLSLDDRTSDGPIVFHRIKS